MNTLLPINPSLYDPALQYSDQYMDVAMMPPIVNQIKQNTDDIEELKEGGGGGSMIVTFTVDNNTVSADKTIAEIVEASATQNVIGVYDGIICQLSIVGEGGATFQNSLSESSNDVTLLVIQGFEEDGVDSWEMRDAISTLVPSILDGSANDVLTINSTGDGVEWAPPSGGGVNVFLVTLTKTANGWTIDKTYSQIDSAYQNGDLILAKTYGVNYIALVSYVSGSGYAGYTTDYMFVTRQSNTNYMTFGSVLIQSDGTILDNLVGNAQCVIFESNG